MSDGTRTRGHLDHNQELYQLSYAHRAWLMLAADRLAQATTSTVCFANPFDVSFAGKTPARAPRLPEAPAPPAGAVRRAMPADCASARRARVGVRCAESSGYRRRAHGSWV